LLQRKDETLLPFAPQFSRAELFTSPFTGHTMKDVTCLPRKRDKMSWFWKSSFWSCKDLLPPRITDNLFSCYVHAHHPSWEAL